MALRPHTLIKYTMNYFSQCGCSDAGINSFVLAFIRSEFESLFCVRCATSPWQQLPKRFGAVTDEGATTTV